MASRTFFQGRSRSFPHERNSWASFVSAWVPGLDELGRSLARSLLDELNRGIDDHELNCFHLVDDPHLSLSRVHSLRHHWIEPLAQSISQKAGALKRFKVSFTGLRVLANEEETRTFVGLAVSDTIGQSLADVTQCVDECLSGFGLRPFYDPPSYHVSLVWCLGDATQKVLHLGRGGGTTWQELESRLLTRVHERPLYLHVEGLKFRAGNKVFQVTFKDPD